MKLQVAGFHFFCTSSNACNWKCLVMLCLFIPELDCIHALQDIKFINFYYMTIPLGPFCISALYQNTPIHVFVAKDMQYNMNKTNMVVLCLMWTFRMHLLQEFSANCNIIYIETDKEREREWGQYTHPTYRIIINYIICRFIAICVFLLKTWTSLTRRTW